MDTEKAEKAQLERNANLDGLIKLQKLDSEIARLSEILDKTLPSEIEELCSSFSNAKEALEKHNQELESIAKIRRDLEASVDDTAVSIAKTKQKLTEVKTNVEYRAVLNEQENLERKIIAIEDRQLELMESAETLMAERNVLNSEAESEERRFQSKKAEKELEMTKLKEQLVVLVLDRKQIKHSIEQDVLAQYERVVKSRNGIGISQVLDRTCQGCYQTIQPQLYYQIRTTGSIYQCPHCDRYLYHNESKNDKATSLGQNK
jgi:hypothetical protein